MKKIFTSVMLMMFAVLTASAQANVFTSNVEFAAGETGKSYLTDKINIGEEQYDCFKIGTAKAAGDCKAILPAGTKTFSFHAIGWSKSDNTPFTVVGAGIDDNKIAGTGNISGNSPYTFDVDGGYDPEAPFFTYTFETALAEETEVTLASDYRVVFYGANVVPAPATGWDGTVTTSLDGQTVTGLADFNNLTLTFPGASSVAVLGEEDCEYLALQNEDGSELYGIWAPSVGSEYTINGNTITLAGFMSMEGVTGNIPAGTTKLYIEDYGTLIIDGESDYLETMVFDANIAAATDEVEAHIYFSVDGANYQEVTEGAAIESASVVKATLDPKYDYTLLQVEKVVWNEPDDWSPQGYYSYDDMGVVVDEEWMPTMQNLGDGLWVASFINAPTYFSQNKNYRVRIRAFETNGDQENWYLYEPADYIVNFVGSSDYVEPVTIEMGYPEYEVNATYEGFFAINASTFEGITISYPYNNVADALGDTEAFQYGALSLVVTDAILCEVDPETFDMDRENPLAAEHFAMSSEYDEVDIFTGAKNVLQPGKAYMAIIPAGGISLVNQMEYDDNWNPLVLWTNQGTGWDELMVYFTTAGVTDGIQNVSNEDNAPMFNLAGQRVNGNVKGIVIKNGKKILVK